MPIQNAHSCRKTESKNPLKLYFFLLHTRNTDAVLHEYMQLTSLHEYMQLTSLYESSN